MTIYHTHHIVPKHMGGTDDSSNLIKLTVEEHAEAHRLLWEQYGNEYDRVAWLGLTKRISKQEASRLAEIENGKSAVKNKTGIHGPLQESWREVRRKNGKTTGKINASKWIDKQRQNNTGMFGSTECPHCNKRGNNVIMKRWHFDNCKYKP